MSVRVPTSEAGASDLLPLLFPLRRYRNGCAYLFVSVEFFPADLCSGGHPTSFLSRSMHTVDGDPSPGGKVKFPSYSRPRTTGTCVDCTSVRNTGGT